MLKKLACIGFSVMIMITLSGCKKENNINEYDKESNVNIVNFETNNSQKEFREEGNDFAESTEENKNDRTLVKNDFLEKLVKISHEFVNYSYLKNYDQLDELLNEIYVYLRNHMDKDEFEKLKQDEIKWIQLKENIKKVRKYTGCSIEGMEAKYTVERCYYLISLIDELKYIKSTNLITLGPDIKIASKISDTDISEVIDLLEKLASSKQKVDVIYYYVDSITQNGDDFLVNTIQYGVDNDCIYADYKTGANDGYFGQDFYCKIKEFDDNLSLKQNYCKAIDEKRNDLPKYELTISKNSKTKKLELNQEKYINSSAVTNEEIKKLDELSKKIASELRINGTDNFEIAKIATLIQPVAISEEKFEELAKYRADAEWWGRDYGHRVIDIDGDGINDLIVQADYGTVGTCTLVLLKGLSDGTYETTTLKHETSIYGDEFVNYNGTTFEFRTYPGWGGKSLSNYAVVLWKNGREAETKYISLNVEEYEIMYDKEVNDIYSEIVKKGIEGLENEGYNLGSAEKLITDDLSSKDIYQCDIDNDGVIEEYSKDFFWTSSWYNQDHVTYKLDLEKDFSINEGTCFSIWVDKDKNAENVICIIDGVAEYDKELIGYKIKDSQCVEVFRIKRQPKIEVVIN